MKVELERKFLVQGNAWRGKGQATHMEQGYLSREQGRTVRVRLSHTEALVPKGSLPHPEAWITIKIAEKDTHALRHMEFDYPLPPDDARLLLDSLGPKEKLKKCRHTFEECGHIWEVDEFSGDNAGLILAEVELEEVDMARPLLLPPWIATEVTHDSGYSNAALVAQPKGVKP